MKKIIKNQVHIIGENLLDKHLKIKLEDIDDIFKDSFKYWCRKFIFEEYLQIKPTDEFVIKQFRMENLQDYENYVFNNNTHFLDTTFLDNKIFARKTDGKLLLLFPFCVDEIEYKNFEYVLTNRSECGFLYTDYNGNFQKTSKMVKTIQTIMLLLEVKTLEVFFIKYNYWEFKEGKVSKWEGNKNVFFENVTFDENFKNILSELGKWFENFVINFISPPFNRENKVWLENTYKKRIT